MSDINVSFPYFVTVIIFIVTQVEDENQLSSPAAVRDSGFGTNDEDGWFSDFSDEFKEDIYENVQVTIDYWLLNREVCSKYTCLLFWVSTVLVYHF